LPCDAADSRRPYRRRKAVAAAYSPPATFKSDSGQATSTRPQRGTCPPRPSRLGYRGGNSPVDHPGASRAARAYDRRGRPTRAHNRARRRQALPIAPSGTASPATVESRLPAGCRCEAALFLAGRSERPHRAAAHARSGRRLSCESAACGGKMALRLTSAVAGRRGAAPSAGSATPRGGPRVPAFGFSSLKGGGRAAWDAVAQISGSVRLQGKLAYAAELPRGSP
jgi:hypothetical protein